MYRAGTVHKGFINFLLDLLIQGQFGVPLYADNPAFFPGGIRLDSFDDIARADCSYCYFRSRFTD
jgi:hypothetical protein